METLQEVAESCPPLKPHCPGGCWRNWEALRRIYWHASPRFPKEAPYLLAAVVVNKTQRINKQGSQLGAPLWRIVSGSSSFRLHRKTYSCWALQPSLRISMQWHSCNTQNSRDTWFSHMCIKGFSDKFSRGEKTELVDAFLSFLRHSLSFHVALTSLELTG